MGELETIELLRMSFGRNQLSYHQSLSIYIYQCVHNTHIQMHMYADPNTYPYAILLSIRSRTYPPPKTGSALNRVRRVIKMNAFDRYSLAHGVFPTRWKIRNNKPGLFTLCTRKLYTIDVILCCLWVRVNAGWLCGKLSGPFRRGGCCCSRSGKCSYSE